MGSNFVGLPTFETVIVRCGPISGCGKRSTTLIGTGDEEGAA